MVDTCAGALVNRSPITTRNFVPSRGARAQRFEERDWRGSLRDAVERIELYDKCVLRAVHQMQARLGDDVTERALWSSIKRRFTELIDALPDLEFDKTFFNSVTRRTFGTIGVDAAVEFVALDLDPIASVKSPIETNVYVNRGSLELLFEEVLADFRFRYAVRRLRSQHPHDQQRSACAMRSGFRRIQAAAASRADRNHPHRVLSDDACATWSAASPVRAGALPFVLALQNTESGVRIDAVMMDESTVSILFSFTRSYFHADLAHVGQAIVFLKSILPRKPVERAVHRARPRRQQGKTERYRELFKHLQNSEDQFVHAPGDKGLVMICFTLPSFDVVFKIIRDRFAYPKNILREEVQKKYEMVFKHDRAGRLVDAQEFKRLEVPRGPLLEGAGRRAAG